MTATPTAVPPAPETASVPAPEGFPGRVSIVVPVFNEEGSLKELHRQIVEMAEANRLPITLLLVDDGSTDASWSIIDSLAQTDPRVRGIRLRRNFGKAAALAAGIREADGSLLLMMDADLQDDPNEVPALIAKHEEGFDVVNGWKKRRLDPWHKVYPSRVFNWLVSRLTGLKLHDHNCGLKLFTMDVARELRLYGELHRFIPVLAYNRGFRVTELPVNHRPREFGSSKYGIRRFLRGLLDLFTVTFLTTFGQRPQHFLGGIGFLFLTLGLCGLGYLGALWVLMNIFGLWTAEPIGTRPLLAYSIAFTLLGGQAVSLGLLAELVVSNTTRDTDHFSIKQRTGSDATPKHDRDMS